MLSAWKVYSRLFNTCQQSMAYRRVLWDGLLASRLKSGSAVLTASGGTSAVSDFLSEKRPELAFEDHLWPTDETMYGTRARAHSYDRVICLESFPGWLNRVLLVDQLKTALKPGGLLVIVSESQGFRAALSQVSDNIRRVRNVHGTKRRLQAILRGARLTPIILSKGILDSTLSAPKLLSEQLLKRNGLKVKVQRLGSVGEVIVARLPDGHEGSTIWKSFTGYADKYRLLPPSSMTAPPTIVDITWKQLRRDPDMLDRVWRTYAKVFGSEDVWGEGAYCDRDPSHIISIEVLNTLKASGPARCVCGGLFKPCFPVNEFNKTLGDLLAPRRGLEPFAALYAEHGEVLGFIWGAVGSLEAIAKRVGVVPAWLGEGGWGEVIRNLKLALKRDYGLTDESRLLYVDDLGIIPGARKGIEPLMLLLRQAFVHAVDAGQQGLLCWTSERSPLFRFAAYAGFTEVARGKQGVVFMFSPDIVPALRILQHSPRAMLPIMVRNAKLYRSPNATRTA